MGKGGGVAPSPERVRRAFEAGGLLRHVEKTTAELIEEAVAPLRKRIEELEASVDLKSNLVYVPNSNELVLFSKRHEELRTFSVWIKYGFFSGRD